MTDKQLEFEFLTQAPPARKPDGVKVWQAEQRTKIIEALKLLRQHPRFIEFMERD